MSNNLKARGADDAGALVSVRDWDPNRTNNSKKQFRSQFYSHYNLGPDLLATLYRDRKEVDRD